FLVMLYAGLRVGETTGLRWCDIDFDKKEISVNHTLVRYYNMNNPRRYTYAINKPKTKSSYRKVPMVSVVYDSLKQLKQFQEDIHLTCKQTIDGYYDFIFINQFGTVQEKGGLNKVLNRIVKECNLKQIENMGNDGIKDVVMLPHISCHILRHTCATRLFESGASTRFVMDILGHADIKTTMNIYVDVTDEHKSEEFSRYQTYMENMKC
ncbi:MAG: site-specific integrase, partial [Erysipelotrichaceae bacterium]|nr:site-specific integrase [Erysipelotrichaceae bacterium]